MKRSLANYSAMKSELAREEQRLKEQEALAVPSGRIGPAEGGPPADDDRLGSIEASKLDIELLEQEVNALKNKVTTAMQSLLGAKEGMQSMTAPANPVAYGFGPLPEPLKGEALEVARKKNQEYLDYCQKHLEEARAAYLSKNRELKREQRRLEGLQKSAGTSEVRTTQAGPSPAGLERRLSDVERKLDLILKTMEKQGREPGKE